MRLNFDEVVATWKDRMRRPRDRLAVQTMFEMCGAKVNFEYKITPRSLISLTWSSWIPAIQYDVWTGARLRVIVNDLHFVGLRVRPQLADHVYNWVRSFCSASPSAGQVILRKILASSAYRRQPDLMFSGKSLMNMENRRGAKRDPSGTPEVTDFQ